MTRSQFLRAAGFTGGLLLIFAVLELTARQLNTDKTDLFWKQQAFIAAAPHTVALVLGSSQMEHAIDPQHLPVPVFNAAYGEQDIYYDYQLAKYGLTHCPHLRALVVGLSYISFGFDVEQHAGFLAKDYFWEYGIWPRSNNLLRVFVYSSVLFNHRTTFFRDIHNGKRPAPPLISSASATNVSPFPENNTLLWNGYRFSRATVPADEQARKTREICQLHQVFYDPANIPANVAYLEAILATANEHGVSAVGIVPPFMASYRERLPASIQTVFAEIVADIGQRHPEFPIYNLSAAPGFTADDFVDPVHLNADGAARFSHLIIPIIRTAGVPGRANTAGKDGRNHAF